MPYQFGSHGQSIMNPMGIRLCFCPFTTDSNVSHCAAVIDIYLDLVTKIEIVADD
jgi:hypothetical protein